VVADHADRFEIVAEAEAWRGGELQPATIKLYRISRKIDLFPSLIWRMFSPPRCLRLPPFASSPFSLPLTTRRKHSPSAS
jgi:hypothetical protein